jgi:hypothetical protein
MPKKHDPQWAREEWWHTKEAWPTVEREKMVCQRSTTQKKWEKKEIAMSSNKTRERRIIHKGVSISFTILHARAHFDLVFYFAINVIQVCLLFHTLPWAPHIAIISSRVKKRQVKCLGEDIYTLSDMRESNEELSKAYFKNLLKTPSCLTWGVEVIWFKTFLFLNYPRWYDRHFKVHKYKVWFGISLMFAPHLWKSCSTIVSSPLLENEQSLSVGELLTALKC